LLATVVIGATVAGVVGIIGFVIVQTVFAGQNTSGWSSLSISMVTLIAPIIAVVTVLGLLMSLNRLR